MHDCRCCRTIISKREPNEQDIHCVTQGQMWLYESKGEIWIFVRIKNGKAVWFNATKSIYNQSDIVMSKVQYENT